MIDGGDSMKRRIGTRAVLNLLAAMVLACFIAAAPIWGQSVYTTGTEVAVEVITPKIIKDLSPWPPPLVSTHGWPLTVRISSDLHKTGRGLSFVGMPYPTEGTQAWMVFSDPDNCPSYLGLDKTGCPPYGSRVADEALMKFVSGVYPRPGPGPDQLNPQGTGVNPNLPGLVIVANKGAGVIAGAAPEYKETGRRNLANYFHTIGFTLADACTPGKPCLTAVTAQMLVPRSVLAPTVILDQNYGVVAFCPQEGRTDQSIYPPSSATAAYREIGGGVVVVPGTILGQGWTTGISPKLELQIAVVNGTAPAVLEGFKSGMPLADYLRGKGYSMLSGVETVNIELHYNAGDRINVIFGDLETAPNFAFKCGVVAPEAPVDREEIPR